MNIGHTKKSGCGDNIRHATSQGRAGLVNDHDEITDDG
jgi:hypothetical protein